MNQDEQEGHCPKCDSMLKRIEVFKKHQEHYKWNNQYEYWERYANEPEGHFFKLMEKYDDYDMKAIIDICPKRKTCGYKSRWNYGGPQS